ncbi:fumarylacetoacetate hydrolase family protein [Bremerella sp. T1]|uniref:fumarylacetoacetate hydrolase family protein n=1 Tax=Bremerella sp. TYQ1 TaxID=3119568 RepID=UPI001CCAB017|nr:fumarylacetoacetate hydrolase family protein [Bremerella volcania]UBM38314.1 fumarylacetoacetate hydrolase family protein [Bremerella volcania]
MRLISYQSETGPRTAVANGDGYVDLHRADSLLPTQMKHLLPMLSTHREAIEEVAKTGKTLEAAKVRLLPPVVEPQKILCIGLNYADHAAETGATVGDEPVVFNKFPTCLRADGQPIELPAVSQEVDYEAELVVVIGRTGRNISEADAMSHVAGYAVGHDVSARDWQKGKPGKQWLLGKSFDSFAPLGPELVTADEIDDPHDLRIQCRLNGETMQDSSTSQLIFRIDFLVSYLSKICTLMPGDLIYTGTPPGVGMARKPPVFMKPGDTVEIEIEGLGVLTNPVIAGK